MTNKYHDNDHEDCKVNVRRDSVGSDASDTSNMTHSTPNASINSLNMSYNNCNRRGINDSYHNQNTSSKHNYNYHGFTPLRPPTNFEMSNSMQSTSRGNGTNSGIRAGYPDSINIVNNNMTF